MQADIAFFDNWTAMTDIQALRCVEYLTQNITQYKITVTPHGIVHIGDRVMIVPAKLEKHKYSYEINSRLFYDGFDRDLVRRLYKKCKLAACH